MGDLAKRDISCKRQEVITKKKRLEGCTSQLFKSFLFFNGSLLSFNESAD
jgi:hypothetical protein